jgi:hypothetical protein
MLASPASGYYHVTLTDHVILTGYVIVTGHVA